VPLKYGDHRITLQQTWEHLPLMRELSTDSAGRQQNAYQGGFNTCTLKNKSAQIFAGVWHHPSADSLQIDGWGQGLHHHGQRFRQTGHPGVQQGAPPLPMLADRARIILVCRRTAYLLGALAVWQGLALGHVYVAFTKMRSYLTNIAPSSLKFSSDGVWNLTVMGEQWPVQVVTPGEKSWEAFELFQGIRSCFCVEESGQFLAGAMNRHLHTPKAIPELLGMFEAQEHI